MPTHPIRISQDRRRFETADAKPFFYLADTAWELFHRLSLDEAERYLTNRAAKGFNFVQAVLLAECGGLTVLNPNGDLPLEEKDPTRPIEAYFRHVDAIVARANALGIGIALLPTWGDKWNRKWGQGPEIFTPDNARVFGEYVGKRYAGSDVIYVLGGDRPVESEAHLAIIRAMAHGIRAGDDGRNLITLHPVGRASSSDFVHGESWLDFHMIQSGHAAMFEANWKRIRRDYDLAPVRPVIDGEPCYENHPSGFQNHNPMLDAYHTRCAAYWSVFSGAAGHTYGCHDIWCMATPDWRPVKTAISNWYDTLDLPGASQVGYVKRLIESRPQAGRFEDRTQTDRLGHGDSEHAPVMRDGTPGANDATYLMAYFPLQRGWNTLDTTCIGAARITARRFNPRTGLTDSHRTIDNTGSFPVPVIKDDGPDQVWIIDDASLDRKDP